MREYVCDSCGGKIEKIGMKDGVYRIIMEGPKKWGFNELEIRAKQVPKQGRTCATTNWEIDLCKDCLIGIIRDSKPEPSERVRSFTEKGGCFTKNERKEVE